MVKTQVTDWRIKVAPPSGTIRDTQDLRTVVECGLPLRARERREEPDPRGTYPPGVIVGTSCTYKMLMFDEPV